MLRCTGPEDREDGFAWAPVRTMSGTVRLALAVGLVLLVCGWKREDPCLLLR